MGAAAVGLGGEAEVVRLEAGADPPEPGVEGHVAAVLVEADPPAPARERRRRGVDAHVRGVGPLVVARRGPLEAQHRRLASRDRAPREPAGDDPVALRVQEDVAVDTPHERSVDQEAVEAGRVEVADDGGAEEADRRAPAQGVLRPAHEVVRERLDLDPVAERTRRHPRVLAAGHRLEHADVPAALRAADELRRTQDGGGGGRVHELARGPPLRLAPDPPRVEQLRLRVEVGRVVARPAAPEAQEDLAALGEERPLLLEEGLERA